ncbi:hypothetical protein [Saccharothrix obliqua]|uniref:hypothetical protein n=1 Tax=Saccharothrix obliqua TaxID=2861747 RepID=UPI001C5D9C3D|nr:hypothetical protein [Saccharothrix obliqua]MBW4718118.1 hypothetical protein [Saccharothrix obliqua]
MANSRRTPLFAGVGVLAVLLVAASMIVAGPVAQSAGPAPAAVVKTRYSPLGATANGPSGPATAKFTVAPYCCPSTAITLTPTTVSTEGDFQWLNLGLPSDNTTITLIEVCYTVTSTVPGRTYISQTRITDMTLPNSALVRLDDPADRNSTSPVCYTVSTSFTPTGTLTLALKVVIGSTSDRINVGMVALTGVAP